MKKNVMLSLLAMSSAPMMMYANADITTQIKDGSWKDALGQDFALDNKLIVSSTGAAVSQNIGNLVPGKYKLTSTILEGSVKVTVNGTELAANGEFEISTETAVTIKTESKTAGQAYKIGNFKLELVYDFKAANERLAAKLAEVAAKIEPIKDTENGKALLLEGSTISEQIKTIVDGKNSEGYDVYKNFELYKATGSVVDKTIATFSAKIDGMVSYEEPYLAAVAKIKGITDDLSAFKNLYLSTTTSYSYKKYIGTSADAAGNTTYNAIANYIANFTSAVDAEYANKSANYNITTFETNYNAYKATLLSNIQKANVNDVDYQEVLASVNAARTGYNDAVANITALLAGETYSKWLEKSLEELSAQLRVINTAKVNNGTDDVHDRATENKTLNKTAIAGAVTAIGNIVTTWTSNKTAYTTATGVVSALKSGLSTEQNKLNALLSLDITNADVKKNLTAQISAINTKITTLSNAIESKKTTVAIVGYDYSAAKTEIEGLIATLQKDGAAPIANYTAYNAMKAAIATLSTNLTKNKNDVAKLKYNEFYVASRYTVTTAIEKTISETTAKIATEYTAKTAVAYQTATFNALNTATQGEINTYLNTAMADIAKYETIQTTIAGYTKALTDLKALVKNNAVVVKASSSNKTYGTRISEITAAIKVYTDKLAAAVILQDAKFTEGLNAIDFTNSTIGSEISTLSASYTADEKIYNDEQSTLAVDMMLTRAKEYVTTKTAEVGALNITQENLGNSLSSIVAEKDVILSLIGKAHNDIQSAEGYKTSEPAKAMALLSEIVKRFEVDGTTEGEIYAKIKNIKASIAAAEIKVATNNTAFTAIMSKYNAASKTLNDATTGVMAIYKDIKYQSKFQASVNTYNTNLNALKSDSIDNYNAKEELAAHQTYIEEDLAKIATGIEALVKDATKYAENYTVKESLIATYNSKNFSTLLGKANAAVANTANTTANSYYVDLYTTLDGLVTSYKAEILSKYGNVVLTTAIKSEYESKLSTLVDNLKKLAADPAENQKNYKSLIAAYDDCNQKWTETYKDINDNDKSDKKSEYLGTLDGYLKELTECYNKIEADFKVGGIYSESLRIALANKITDISTRISATKSAQEGGYNDAIVSDNSNDHKANVNAITSALETYYSTIETINKYSSIKFQTVAVSDIINTNADIYNYIDILRTLSTDELAAYEAIMKTPGVRYNTTAQAQANIYKAEIIAKLEAFQTKINDQIKADFNAEFDNAKTLYSTAMSAVSSYATKNSAFTDVKNIINTIKLGVGSMDFALNVDTYVEQLNTIGGLLEAGKVSAAENEWKYQYNEANKKKATWLAALNNFVYIESNTTDYLGQFNQLVTDNFDEAVELYNQYTAEGTLFANLSTATAKLNTFTTNGESIYIAAEAASGAAQVNTDNNAKIVDDLDALSTDLKTATDFCLKYSTSSAKLATLQSMQDDIEAQRAKAANLLKNGGSKAYYEGATFASFKTKLNSDIVLYYRASTNDEIIAVREIYIESLKKECNTVAVSDVKDINKDAITACQEKIVDFTNRITDINTKYSSGIMTKEVAQPLILTMESEITAERSKMITIYAQDSISTLNTKLTNAINSLVASKNAKATYLESCNEEVQTVYSARFAKVVDFISGIQSSVTAAISENKALLYENNITLAIQTANSYLDPLYAEISTAQQKYDINDAAYFRLNAELAGLSATLVEKFEIIKNLPSYERYKFDYQSYYDGILNTIANNQNTLESKKSNVSLTGSSVNADKASIEYHTQYLYNTARYNEYVDNIRQLYSTVNEISTRLTATGSKFTDSESLNNKKTSLNSSVNYLNNYNNAAYVGYSIGVDIDGNKFKDAQGNDISKNLVFDDEAKKIEDKIALLSEELTTLKESVIDAEYKSGDADLDNSITVNDYNTIKTYIVSDKTTVDKFDSYKEFAAAKCSGTGSVINIGDLTKVAKAILDGAGFVSNPSKAEASSKSVSVNPDGSDAISISAEGEGTTKRIAINLSNSISYVGCQMDITLPSGMKLVGESLTNRANGHALSSSDLEDGTHRVVISSVENNAFNDSESAILYLDVEITGKVYRDIEVSNVLFSDADARVFSIGNTNSGNLTGVDSIKDEQTIGSRIYDAGGRLLKSIKNGVNIIRNSDGSTKKVMGK